MNSKDLIPTPLIRNLRIFAFDPSVASQLELANIAEITIPISWEEDLQPGPVGEYVEVVDVDPASGVFYKPINLNDPQLLAQNGLSAATIWPIAVLLGGVLLAESAWVNGQLWRGSRGMLLWGGLLGLLAVDQLMPWVVALALGWLALHPGWYGRHT